VAPADVDGDGDSTAVTVYVVHFESVEDRPLFLNDG
jgi:hypothetical protein